MKYVKRPGDKHDVPMPAFFEHEGFYAAMIPQPRGGIEIIKDGGSPNITDFMAEGSVIEFRDLPESMKESIWEGLEKK
ncbi:MAG: hypothetical protein WC489_00525 [Patescibacteria group bacterium]